MHIPSGDIIVRSFSDTLIESCRPSPDYDVNKWLFVPNVYDEYRYILGTKGKKPLICVGINPSTAAPDSLDNTLRSVERIASSNGYDSFIMFNVSAQRATKPEDMDRCINKRLHSENMKAFEYILSLCDSQPSVWAAWGNLIESRDYLGLCLNDMISIGKKYNAVWFSAGRISGKGHPHHPLYLRKDSSLDLFDIESYHTLLNRTIHKNKTES